MSQKSQDYLADLGSEILLMARDAQRDAKNSIDGFEKGRKMAFYEVLSLMKQQADVFELDHSAISLEGVDLESLLTSESENGPRTK